MRYFLDTEFIDTGSLIDLISIALVCEDGRELHLQSSEFDSWRASAWVQEHVFPHLALCPRIHVRGKRHLTTDLVAHEEGQCTFTDPAKGIAGGLTDCLWRTRNQIALEIRAFCDPEKYGKPELWGWCAGYDFVALCQLFGTMMELPAGFPHYIHELQDLLDARRLTDDMLPPQPEQAHNALADARYIHGLWEWLTVTGVAPRHWLSDKVVRDRMLHGIWLSDQKPLILRNDLGAKLTGGIIPPDQLAIVEESGPKSELVYGGEAGATILPSKVGGQREGKTHVHVHLDNEEIKPEDWKALAGYVGHELSWGDPVLPPEYVPAAKDLAMLRKPLPLPTGMTEEEAQQVFLPPVSDGQELQTFTPHEGEEAKQ